MRLRPHYYTLYYKISGYNLKYLLGWVVLFKLERYFYNVNKPASNWNNLYLLICQYLLSYASRENIDSLRFFCLQLRPKSTVYVSICEIPITVNPVLAII